MLQDAIYSRAIDAVVRHRQAVEVTQQQLHVRPISEAATCLLQLRILGPHR
jgi:hypothetical protein